MFKLKPSRAKEEAQRLLEAGEGDVSSMEVIDELTRLAYAKGVDIEFHRVEKDRTVIYSRKEARIACMHDSNMLPLGE